MVLLCAIRLTDICGHPVYGGAEAGCSRAKKPMAFETYTFELVSAIPLVAHREPMT